MMKDMKDIFKRPTFSLFDLIHRIKYGVAFANVFIRLDKEY